MWAVRNQSREGGTEHMVMRKASPDTDQVARSLLQKAVRRGNASVAEATFRYLLEEKDEFIWLRSRLAVMTFEEAWPYGLKVTFGRSESEVLGHYLALCGSEKNKDAAGLGSLAYALSEDDRSVLADDEGDWYIRVIAKALKEREKFWDWIKSEAVKVNPIQNQLIDRAYEGSKKAGWPWDKAFTYAAALLALKEPVPNSSRINSSTSGEFPYWTAIDKHTKRGKEVIRAVAKDLDVPANTALWLSFYLESAVCAHMTFSPWWEREKRWRMAKLGLLQIEAENIWSKLRPIVAERLSDDAEQLARRIGQYKKTEKIKTREKSEPSTSQGSLF